MSTGVAEMEPTKPMTNKQRRKSYIKKTKTWDYMTKKERVAYLKEGEELRRARLLESRAESTDSSLIGKPVKVKKRTLKASKICIESENLKCNNE